MYGRRKDDDTLFLKLLLRIKWFNHIILFLIVFSILIIDQISIGLIEVERINRPFRCHLLMLNRQIHL